VERRDEKIETEKKKKEEKSKRSCWKSQFVGSRTDPKPFQLHYFYVDTHIADENVKKWIT
jgi:hypothetical protein